MMNRLELVTNIWNWVFRRIWAVVLFSLALYGIIVYSSWGRPLWIDEYFHFAWGGIESPVEAFRWVVLVPTIIGPSHYSIGNSWFYHFLDWIALSSFGASELALRWPSYAAGVCIFVFVWVVFRNLGVPIYWTILAFLALLGQKELMYYVGEARPYILVSATVIGMLAYYTARGKSNPGRLSVAIGWISAVIGMLNHAYFLPYLFLIGLVMYFNSVAWYLRATSIRSLLQFLNPKLLITVLAIALVTRGRHFGGSTRENFDPFEFTRTEGGVLRVISDIAFQFLPLPQVVAVVISLMFCIFFFVMLLVLQRSNMSKSMRAQWTSLASPLSLIVGSLLTIGVIATASYLNGYWIIQRQWLGSLVLIPVSFVWLLASICVGINFPLKALRYVVVVVFAVGISLNAVYRLDGQTSGLISRVQQPSIMAVKTAEATKTKLSLKDPVGAARTNLVEGGPVWRSHLCWYVGWYGGVEIDGVGPKDCQ